ncbi:MAG: hypothetical protein M9928_00470 [Anaerolineae bacterium]|nr:hypothetical protein [Anaerolineae bacterium]MCO5188289.1 hypothetical protein [Anaerolineae bacterium]MCO5195255.1 hypothetical protein [Anaerolineae bacterium]MCO5197876.1 hypothetical protein [Anaerolineae bacterium]MCO5203481.1 hypothetical protein [Anaerolineae bacterium]
MDIETIRTVGIGLLVCVAVAGILGIALLVIMAAKVRRMNIPADANFFETLRFTPLSVAIGIDLLDLGFDFLAAPVSWLILDWMGLKALRGFAAFEALIPFTGFIPVMTIAWVLARLQAPSAKTL